MEPKLRFRFVSLSFFVAWTLLFVFSNGCSCNPPVPGEGDLPTESKAEGGKESSNDGSTTEPVKEFDGRCQKRCDCPQGEECSEGRCIQAATPLYCCDKPGCPTGATCLDIQGATSNCEAPASCKHACDCKQGLGCVDGFCSAVSPSVFCCEKAGCTPGSSCLSIKGGLQTCGGEGSTCTSACDCVASLACVNGFCTKGIEPVYCCDDATCPPKARCQNRRGGLAVCGEIVPCKTSCDCPTGQPCNQGRCEAQPVPVYCCDKTDSCPAGQACDTSSGIRKTCEAKPACKGPCDCPQGQNCVSSACVVEANPTYCCEKEGCPAQSKCFTPAGTTDICRAIPCRPGGNCGKPSCTQAGDRCTETVPTCSPTTSVCVNEVFEGLGICDPSQGRCQRQIQCKTHCDCPQEDTCSQGQCIPSAGRKPTYCCSKPGCPIGEACFKQDGSPDICPNLKPCASNLDCGSQKCQDTPIGCTETLPVCNRDGSCTTSQNSFPARVCTIDPTGAGSCTQRPVCKTPCECPSGQDCSNGACVAGPIPVFCCTDPACRPTGARCFKQDGTSGVCPPPSACQADSDCGPPTCQQLGNDCSEATFLCDRSSRTCTNVGSVLLNATCNAAQGRCIPNSGICRSDTDCGKPSCQQNGSLCIQRNPRCVQQSCTESGSSQTGLCNSQTGLCTPAQACTAQCDCPQSQACVKSGPIAQGLCQPVSGVPAFCCDLPLCPSGNPCTKKDGSAGVCAAACTSPCDCAPGLDCISGQCIGGIIAVYCCDNPATCPAGQMCKSKSGQSGTCPSTPRPCTSACDCLQGEGCFNNVCLAGTKPVYCCTNPGCPQGQACQDKNSLQGTCPVPCALNCDCPQGQRCVQRVCTASQGLAYCCSKAGCPSGQSCQNTNGTSSTCPTQPCSSSCDCTQGQDCRNNVCTTVFPAVYCCDNPNCPTGQACKDRAGVWKTCGGQPACTSPCDCNQGEDCFRGQCIRVSPAVYCCSKVGCPGGQSCIDQNNQRSSCPGVQCNSSCDCNQGQACIRNACVFASPSVFCCSKPGCQPGQVCENANGTLSTCPGQACTTACDCNQGQDCRNRVCTNVSPPVFCCSKSGCRSGQACVNSNGTTGSCPASCRLRCDCPQGQDCLNGTCFASPGAFCCNKAGCPQGNSCLNPNGSAGVCPSTPQTCATRCDCPQGQDCSAAGRCEALPFPAYCCDNANCPQGFSCLDRFGRSGFCPTTPPPPPPPTP